MKAPAVKKKLTMKKNAVHKKTADKKGVGMDVILKAVAYAKKHPIVFADR